MIIHTFLTDSILMKAFERHYTDVKELLVY